MHLLLIKNSYTENANPVTLLCFCSKNSLQYGLLYFPVYFFYF